MRGEGHEVGRRDALALPSLHAFGRDVPFALVQIDLRSFSFLQLDRANEHQRRELQGGLDDEGAAEGFDGAQQGRNLRRVDERREVFFLSRG